MTNEEFKYWINGYLSLSSEEFINGRQVNIINNHANLVKAVSGKLDDINSHFIAILSDKIRTNGLIPLHDLNSICSDWFK